MSTKPSTDLFNAIQQLKRERNAVIMAHYYQEPDVQDIADVLGDSLELARKAQQTDADVIVLCGVHFMAETAKILNPHKTVILPDAKAGCSLADGCQPDDFRKFKEQHPDHVVVSYINTSAAIKAMSDWICTSSNACQVVNAIPAETPVLFAPDLNLGRYVQQQTGRQNMLLWQGSCIVHETFHEQTILQQLAENPGSELIAHPECGADILRHAHFIGSTKKLLEYVQKSPVSTFVVATEAGIIHTMNVHAPQKKLIPAMALGANGTCGCSMCPYMRLNTLEKLYRCLNTLQPAIHLEQDTMNKALLPIQRMLSLP